MGPTLLQHRDVHVQSSDDDDDGDDASWEDTHSNGSGNFLQAQRNTLTGLPRYLLDQVERSSSAGPSNRSTRRAIENESETGLDPDWLETMQSVMSGGEMQLVNALLRHNTDAEQRKRTLSNRSANTHRRRRQSSDDEDTLTDILLNQMLRGTLDDHDSGPSRREERRGGARDMVRGVGRSILGAVGKQLTGAVKRGISSHNEREARRRSRDAKRARAKEEEEVGNLLLSDDFWMEGLGLGVGPVAVQQGDLVVILQGCDSPVLLRPRNERYELVGGMYVEGVNEGGFVEFMSGGQCSLRNFEIV